MERGTFAQFNMEHMADCISADLPKMGYINGIAAPQNQLTVALYDALQNPDGSDDYIWKYLPQDLINLNWIKGE